jgi:dTDP-4-dehydrorhamnose 3,5-epimerase
VRFLETPLPGAFLIEFERHIDERGFFARAWCADELRERGLHDRIDQVNFSRNARAGTLRGMHLQIAPHEEVKIVRCIRGAIYDVIVDLRDGSATHGGWHGVRLDETDSASLYIPQGFAHGFQTLTDDADVLYLMSTGYEPEAARGVRWDDPAFGIEWPKVERRTISERDKAWPDYHRGVSA